MALLQHFSTFVDTWMSCSSCELKFDVPLVDSYRAFQLETPSAEIKYMYIVCTSKLLEASKLHELPSILSPVLSPCSVLLFLFFKPKC